ncbi:glycoside hydrolase family 5 protein [Thiotrichales bacterium 19S11-10]|nr:glycoside hydrolase family 5 protein [Thiotrichales bacterium 19S11-10]
MMTNKISGLYDTEKAPGASNVVLCIKNDDTGIFVAWDYGTELNPNAISRNDYYWGAAVRTGGCSYSDAYYGYLSSSFDGATGKYQMTYEPVEGSHIVLENYYIDDNIVHGNLGYSSIAYNDELSQSPNTGNRDWLSGINLSGLEFSTMPNSSVIPSLSYTDSTTDYTDLSATNTFIEQGANTIRLPIRWAYMNPYGYTINLAENPYFDTGYFDKLVLPTIQTIINSGNFVILDLHSYMHYSNVGTQVAGCGNGTACPDGTLVTNPNAHVKIWSQIWDQISKYKGSIDTSYLYFDLMNEPATKSGESLTPKQAFDAQVAIIKALNAKGFDGYYLVEGISWTGLHSWSHSGNAAQFTRANFKAAGLTNDEINRIIINVHQYLDSDFSGTHNTCISNITEADNMDSFVQYLKENQLKAMVTEFGVGTDEATCAPALDAFLNQMKENAYTAEKDYGFVGWTVWSTGHGWGNYNLRVTPGDWKNNILKQYFQN